MVVQAMRPLVERSAGRTKATSTCAIDDDDDYFDDHMMIKMTNQHPEDGGRGGRHPSCEDTQSLNKVLIITMILAFMAMKKFIAMCKSLFFISTKCHKLSPSCAVLQRLQ